MNIPGLDASLCEKRNRVVARKESVEGVPIRFLTDRNAEQSLFMDFSKRLDDIEPTTMLDAINAKLPEGAAKLTADDVYIHILEAANSNFVGDRYMFLAESTLRNIAADAERGFAFMNSHRTGSLSQPSELPFGQTFAGQFQAGTDADGNPMQRALVGVYMLRGVKPNGDGGPSTDDLHRMIEAGQVSDVSVGLTQGEAFCDVCGTNLMQAECAHVPGTRRAMDDLQIDAQKKKGVPEGRCSYTLENARCGEVSAVFNGAVPGAGVKKVMSLRKKGKLAHREWKEARAVFGSLLSGDLSMDSDLFSEVAEAVETGVRAALADRSESPVPTENDIATAPASTVTEPLANVPSEPAALRATQSTGVEQMAEEIVSVVNPDSADTANPYTDLTAKLSTLQAEVEKLTARNARLEAEAQMTRFAAEVEGTATGKKWFGDTDKHKTMLVKLASAFGEDSAEVKQYIEQNRAFAAQMAESVLLQELGSNHAGNESATALEQLTARASEIHAANPALTKEQAFAQATQVYPALYEQHVRETRGGK